MRRGRMPTISSQEVQRQAVSVVQEHLQIEDYSKRCTASVFLSVLFFAAARVSSIFDACARLRGAPSDETIRRAAITALPDLVVLERRINLALASRLPKTFRRTYSHSLGRDRSREKVSFDITLIPYHGEPMNDIEEVYRSQPKSGTSHFHAYATAYVVRKGQRFTVALTYVKNKEPMKDVVARLLRRIREIGLEPRFVLLDRGFYSIDVIRYLQAARCPFLMPVVHRGKAPKDPETAKGTRRFLSWKKSGWSEHTLEGAGGRSATVSICVSLKNYAGRHSRRGRKVLVYAYWGFEPPCTDWVRETYRERFGIETSYRQMNQCRIRTTTRNPAMRLLFFGLALILRNIWVWLHLTIFGVKLRGGHVVLRLELLRLRTMLLHLQRWAEATLGATEDANAQPAPA